MSRDRAGADPDSLQQLGSMLYAQGEWLLENGEDQPSLDALAEAEQSYARLGPRIPAQLITDVALRRARVLAHGGTVQLGSGGDPDLAVAAADWALRKYLGAFRRGDQLSVPQAHVSAVEAAARTAYIAHAAAGRPDLAETLTAPATDLRLLMPTMRCPDQLAPAVAEQLAELGDGLDGAARILLYLEAHALFADASQDQVSAMRYQLDHFGPRWAVTVMRFGQDMTELGQTAAAVDAADWLGGILQQLAPWTMTSDEARTTAADIETWRQSVYSTSGD